MSKAQVVQTKTADQNHQVVSVKGGPGGHRSTPCGGCPWVKENAGSFPAEAFRISAATCYDMADHVFACHESGTSKPATCAGFLMRGADHNLAVRLKIMKGEYDPSKVSNGGRELFEGYREMAIANGVSPDDPAIKPCR